MLARLKCESLIKRSPRLPVVCLSVCLSAPRHISKTKPDRHEMSSPLWEIGVAEQEYDVIFSLEVAKYYKNGPKPQNSP